MKPRMTDDEIEALQRNGAIVRGESTAKSGVLNSIAEALHAVADAIKGKSEKKREVWDFEFQRDVNGRIKSPITATRRE